MSTTRFIAILSCWIASVMILAGPFWLRYFDSMQSPQLLRPLKDSNLVKHWVCGWSRPGWADRFIGSDEPEPVDGIFGKLKLFKSHVTRESAGGVTEVMCFAEIEATNNTDSSITVNHAQLSGFWEGIKIFDIPTVTSSSFKPITVPKGESVPLRSDGVYIPVHLVHDQVKAYLSFDPS